MKINKSELQKALERVKPGLANKELIEQTTSFAFRGNRVMTYNDEISISHPVKDMDITGAVKAASLYAFLNKIKKDEIEVEKEDNQIKITAGKSKAGLVFEQEVKMPVEEIGKIGEWKPIPENLLDAFKMAAPCCSADMSRPVLTCVKVEENRVIASDSFQLIIYDLKTPMPFSEFLLPASSARELVKYKITKMAEGQGGWVHFTNEEDSIFSSRVLAGTFPKVDALLKFEGVEFSFPKNTVEALERAEIFCDKDSAEGMKVVVVDITEGAIKFSAKDDCGWFEEILRMRYKGEPVRFMIAANYLKQLIDRTLLCIFGENRVKFSGENWEHVVVVMNEGEKE